MKIAHARKYLRYLKNSRYKFVNLTRLSHGTNIQEDIVLDDFVCFEPLIKMYGDLNFRKFTAELEDFVKSYKPKERVIKKKVKTENYDTLKDFIYDKMLLPGGFIDRLYEFSEEDLKTIRRLSLLELKKKRNSK